MTTREPKPCAIGRKGHWTVALGPGGRDRWRLTVEVETPEEATRIAREAYAAGHPGDASREDREADVAAERAAFLVNLAGVA